MRDTVLISPETLRKHLNTYSSYDKAQWIRLPYTEWRNANTMSSAHAEAMIKVVREDGYLFFDNGEKSFKAPTDAWTFGFYIEPKIFEGVTLTGPCIQMDGSISLNNCSYIDINGTRLYPTENNNEKNEEIDTMNTNSKFMNFEFGPISESSIRMSLYGLAVKNVSGTWVSYDASTCSIMDVDILNFNGRQFMYKVPVAIGAVTVGDIVIHARKPMFVTEVKANSLMAIDPVDGEYKEIVLTKSPFGFNFVTKVVNLMDGFMNTPASQENPFGNMWMLMAMNSNEGKDIDPMMLMLMMSQGNMGNMNPMMLAMMMNNSDKDTSMRDMLLLSMMMGNQNHTCHCVNNYEDRAFDKRFHILDVSPEKKPAQPDIAFGESAESGARVVAHPAPVPEQISEAVKNNLSRPSKN